MASGDGGGGLWPLVRALQPLPCLAQLGDRNLVVRMLIDELGPLQIEEDARAIRHLYSIVEVCKRHPDGLTTLLEVVGRFDQDTMYLPEVRRIILQMTALEVFPAEERDQVFRLLSGMVFSDIVELYRLVGGDNAPELPAQTTYREVFLTLETLNADPEGLPKPLIFVEHLASRVRPELAIELRRWADRQAARLELITELQAVRRVFRAPPPPGPPPNSPAYLVVQIQHSGPSGDRYHLSHWRQLDVADGWHPERGKDFTGSIEQVKHQVAVLIEGVEADWARYQPDIRLEVVLSGELLNLDVDRWSWETETELPEPVGCRYAVVVRSLERMQSRKWHRAWHARWGVLTRQMNSNGAVVPESVRWGESCQEHALRALTAAFENDSQLVSLLLSAPPQPAAMGRDEVAVGLRAGVPVMLWHRQDCGSKEFESTVRELLHGDGPGTVLQRARQIRATAFAADDRHVGHHLALLWDDPERIVVPGDAGPPKGASAA